jgi:hypothetical protein
MLSSVLELKREQVAVAEYEMKSHHLARQTTDVAGVFPCGCLIDGIAEQLVRVGEREAGDGRASRVLNLDSDRRGWR